MNDLQSKEFDILKKFVEICEQLHLPYFLVCGTALGAVKYGGFIPWDDDIDVGMYRRDYERFCREAPALLPQNYFLQTYQTDPGFPYIFAKLRDSDTTYVEKSNSRLNIHHGIYIDIFPLDGYPPSEKEAKSMLRCKSRLDLKRACVFQTNENFSLRAKVFLKAERILGYHKRVGSTVKKIEKLISQWDVEQSVKICNHGNWQGEREFAPRYQYGQGTYMTFEGLRVRVPEQYDEYLTQKYGDWRADLPADQQVGHHYYAICDVARPYTDYVEIVRKDEIRIKTR